ncbi:MAG: multifunctional oxoglutarate decarboxylase/oxoglutarate dehydrogenase thiamine pyrophosphate-binding subunit/dihydrolipoyllysine-residue succinyltransferase subunit, partial [Actinomycetota bacterium]|nr:multifunctional oxoglutarate decarboxylase/oxoglutarate dehydrogenase thiamine pyrophosphate-binding subunit/dihydrolipoyllysine-residue succinyltransferase subunit [Actinomycetota bacterium]
AVRLCGQDTRRGTFAHRHAVVVDHHDETEFFPLRHLDPEQGAFFVYDSMLSEYAAVGVEYGYSIVDRTALVAWEGQFGDFVNGAQIIIDQFLAAGADKWNQQSGLVLLLPHGYEGQGPEHSSARIERFLTLCAEGNLTVANATTAAQFFHLLRRQVQTGNPRPLIALTPKSGLRARYARSPVEELVSGHFRETIDDESGSVQPDRVRRVLLCSGKVAFDAIESRNSDGVDDTAVVRVEQIYPWPAEQVAAILDRYPSDADVVWLQEEPANMGAWSFVRTRIDELLGAGRQVRLIGRPESGSPACGSTGVHQQELAQLMATLLG